MNTATYINLVQLFGKKFAGAVLNDQSKING